MFKFYEKNVVDRAILECDSIRYIRSKLGANTKRATFFDVLREGSVISLYLQKTDILN